MKLPAQPPDLNGYAERWVQSANSECLSRIILMGEDGLWRELPEYATRHHRERNHQSLDSTLLFPEGLAASGEVAALAISDTVLGTNPRRPKDAGEFEEIYRRLS